MWGAKYSIPQELEVRRQLNRSGSGSWKELDVFLRARTALTEGRSAPQTEFAFDGCLLLFGHACCEVGSIEMHAADGGTSHGTSALP